MFTIPFAQIVLGLYAVLLAVGGFIGYKKAGSRPSLFAGAGSALFCLSALLASVLWEPRPGLQAALIVVLLLTLLFNYRFVAKSRKFMPSGLLAVASLAVLATLVITLV